MQAMLHTTENTLISLALLAGYAFCVFMFMIRLRGRQSDRMASIENLSMDYLSECRKAGRGEFRYFVPYTHPERIIRWYAELFNKAYLRVYEASFWDEGVSTMNSNKIIAVSKRQLFEMKLKGMVNTNDHERAAEALAYVDVKWPIP